MNQPQENDKEKVIEEGKENEGYINTGKDEIPINAAADGNCNDCIDIEQPKLRNEVSAKEEEEESVRVCRICLDEEDGDNKTITDLIAPCECKGNSKWVHRHCLDQWRATNAEQIAFSQCLECRANYTMVSTMSSKMQKKIFFCLYITRDALLATIAVQLLIAVFGLIFWGIALIVFDQPADDVEQKQLLGDCETTRCVMGLSYCGGVLLLLFTMGFVGSIVLCNNDCRVDHSVQAVGYRSRSGAAANNTSSRSNCGSNNCYCDLSGCGDGDAAGCLVILLAVVGIVLVSIGFLVGCFIAVIGFQSIIQRHLWRLQKRRLVSEYRVVDLASRESTAPHTTSPPAPPEGVSLIGEDDSIRLKKLGLME